MDRSSSWPRGHTVRIIDRAPDKAARRDRAREGSLDHVQVRNAENLQRHGRGQERRARSVESLVLYPEVGLRRVQDHRDILAALHNRDPDLVEQVFRRHTTAGVELLLNDLD
jgi:DNA-binding GntR family transcriptional regulator